MTIYHIVYLVIGASCRLVIVVSTSRPFVDVGEASVKSLKAIKGYVSGGKTKINHHRDNPNLISRSFIGVA